MLGDEAYYSSRAEQIRALLEDHAQGWRPFLAQRHGERLAELLLSECRGEMERLIPSLPYIGGNRNPMTRHLLRSTTSLVLHSVMLRHGRSAEETGWVLYHAVAERISHLPAIPFDGLSDEERSVKRHEAQQSQARRYPGDWVWEFVEADDGSFGYDFFECGTQKLYQAQGTEDVLPFYCYLDLVTHRLAGWRLLRTMTLSQGCDRCDFRFRRGRHTPATWPPPFLGEQRE